MTLFPYTTLFRSLPSNVKARAPGDEVVPAPAKDEVVIFSEHLFRGFTPPGNLFFRQLLAFYKLRIHDLAPNSVLTLSNFVTLCEDYLQIKPDLDLWLELFYCNPQPETSGGPLLQCGAVALQRRLHSVFPKPVFPNRIKDWQKTFFYCKDTSPADEPKLPLFSEDRLEATPLMKARCSEAARPKLESLIFRDRKSVV